MSHSISLPVLLPRITDDWQRNVQPHLTELNTDTKRPRSATQLANYQASYLLALPSLLPRKAQDSGEVFGHVIDIPRKDTDNVLLDTKKENKRGSNNTTHFLWKLTRSLMLTEKNISSKIRWVCLKFITLRSIVLKKKCSTLHGFPSAISMSLYSNSLSWRPVTIISVIVSSIII